MDAVHNAPLKLSLDCIWHPQTLSFVCLMLRGILAVAFKEPDFPFLSRIQSVFDRLLKGL